MGMKLQTMYKRKRLPKIKIDPAELQHFAQTPEVPQYWHDLYSINGILEFSRNRKSMSVLSSIKNV